MNETNNWWRGFYDDLLEEVLLTRTSEAETEATLDFIIRHLEVRPEARVFDQCCGIGSLALPLARRGFAVHGVDQATPYIEKAAALARQGNLSASFVEADAFEYVPEPCDGAFNWWTSFGYADDDRTNLCMLRRAHAALVAGGRFILDTMNAPGILRHFERDIVTERETSRGRVTLHRRSALDLEKGRVLKTWRYFLPRGEKVVHQTSVRLYLPSTLREMLLEAGFETVALFGDLNDSPLDIDHLRCICVATKSAGPT